MKSKKILFLFLLIPLVAFSIHKYYISLCEIDFIEDKKSVQITLGMFIDDIELTLNKDNNTKLNIDTPKEVEKIDEYFESYLNNHFKLTINNKAAIYQYIGKEYDDDIVRFYLEITDIAKLNSIEISNTCLTRDFEDQQNIIKISANRKHKTFYFNKKTYKGLLKF